MVGSNSRIFSQRIQRDGLTRVTTEKKATNIYRNYHRRWQVIHDMTIPAVHVFSNMQGSQLIQLINLTNGTFKESNQTSSVGRFFFKKYPRKTEYIKTIDIHPWCGDRVWKKNNHCIHLPKTCSCFSLPLTFHPSTVFASITSRRKPGGVTLGSTWQRPLGGFHFFIGYQRSRRRVDGDGKEEKGSSPYTLILQIGSMDDTDLRMLFKEELTATFWESRPQRKATKTSPNE